MKEALKTKALEILDACHDLAIATVREDGFPQATTVSFVHNGLTLYVGVGKGSQKARNMRRDKRVSMTMTAPYKDWDSITGLSMAAHADEVDVIDEMDLIGKLMLKRFPEIADMDDAAEMGEATFFRFTPEVMSILDYSKGFGHADTVKVDEYDIAESLESMQHRWLIPAA
ncbi:MAG: pyridoxamine 5'-phosphate oxidase family protein [Henriciella sp.]|nr:pyridoxamine 5'-phosphate oxidase family protein [Henriciella sp.]